MTYSSQMKDNITVQGSIFHYGSISLIEEPCRSTHLAALKIAKEARCILSYDPNLRLPLWPSSSAAREGIKSIWEYADVIKVSEEEISFLTGGEDPYSHEVLYNKLFHHNLRLLLVTEGQDGCRYYTKKFHGRVNGFRVKVVDTTGAGDSFVSGLLTNWASNPDLYKAKKELQDLFDSLGQVIVDPNYNPQDATEDGAWKYATVSFGKVRLEKPSFWVEKGDLDEQELKLTPKHARLQNMTYSSQMKVNIIVQVIKF